MGMPNGSYGFNILNERAQPVLSIGWTDEEVRRAVGLLSRRKMTFCTAQVRFLSRSPGDFDRSR